MIIDSKGWKNLGTCFYVKIVPTFFQQPCRGVQCQEGTFSAFNWREKGDSFVLFFLSSSGHCNQNTGSELWLGPPVSSSVHLSRSCLILYNYRGRRVLTREGCIKQDKAMLFDGKQTKRRKQWCNVWSDASYLMCANNSIRLCETIWVSCIRISFSELFLFLFWETSPGFFTAKDLQL